MDYLTKDLDLPASQILALFNRIIRKVVHELSGILEREVESKIVTASDKEVVMEPTRTTMNQDLVRLYQV